VRISSFPVNRVRFGVGLALAAGLASLAGCATNADLLQVQRDQREVRALLADQQVAIDGLRRRLEILRGEVGESGRTRAQGAAPSELVQRVNDIDTRLGALEQGRAQGTPTMPPLGGEQPPGAEPQVRLPPTAPTPVPPKVASPEEAEVAKEETALQGARVDNDYREAIGLIRQGQCAQAIPRLRDFIRKNAKSDYADNAQYWIGSCYYGQHDYNRAIIELNEVLLKYPKGDKVPAALLMLADAFADSGDKIDARLILQKLTSDHPHTEEAEKGRQKLQSLGE